MNEINSFLLGALVTASLIAGLFFLRFWSKSRDRLFGLFAIAFWLLAANWLFLLFTHGDEAAYWGFYWLRLLAFLLILIGIADKNRSRPAA